MLPKATVHDDERVLPSTWDLPRQRFLGSSSLRMAAVACVPCCQGSGKDVKKSPNATAARKHEQRFTHFGSGAPMTSG